MKLFSDDNKPFSQLEVSVESKGRTIKAQFSFLDGFGPHLNGVFALGEDFERKIGLWENTCIELFLKNKHGEDYYEINLATNSMHWNAFYFSHYRSTPLTETKDIILKEVRTYKDQLSFSLQTTKLVTNYDIHPKAIIYVDHGPPIHLSDFMHPNTGPDFHLFPVT